jgi:hypothetical protein
LRPSRHFVGARDCTSLRSDPTPASDGLTSPPQPRRSLGVEGVLGAPAVVLWCALVVRGCRPHQLASYGPEAQRDANGVRALRVVHCMSLVIGPCATSRQAAGRPPTGAKLPRPCVTHSAAAVVRVTSAVAAGVLSSRNVKDDFCSPRSGITASGLQPHPMGGWSFLRNICAKMPWIYCDVCLSSQPMSACSERLEFEKTMWVCGSRLVNDCTYKGLILNNFLTNRTIHLMGRRKLRIGRRPLRHLQKRFPSSSEFRNLRQRTLASAVGDVSDVSGFLSAIS